MVDLSLIIPVYNERESIDDTLRVIQERFASLSESIQYELIVVDDGSTDGTEEVLKLWPSIKLITNEFNRGYGASLKAGIRQAKGKVIGITDADGTYPNRTIPELYRKMNAEDADMIVAARTRGTVKIPLVRRPAKLILTLLANYLTGRKIPDLNSGLRLFRREHALRYFNIISDGFSFTTTLTLAMLVNDYSVIFEPIEYAARSGRSKIRPLRDTFNFLILILRTIAFFNPLKIFIPLSFLVFIMAAACLAYQLATGNVGDLSVILLLSSLQIFLIGIIADLISRKN